MPQCQQRSSVSTCSFVRQKSEKTHTEGLWWVMEIFYIWTVALGAQLGKVIKITGHLKQANFMAFIMDEWMMDK